MSGLEYNNLTNSLNIKVGVAFKLYLLVNYIRCYVQAQYLYALKTVSCAST